MLTLAERLLEVMDGEPIPLTEIMVRLKRKGWHVPEGITNTLDYVVLLVQAMARDDRFQREPGGKWHVRA